ncbi:MAG: O-antigen translocase [Pseudomonadota bacterium]|nr:O-antigen translocase [Pseudomonadota bacterium]
MPSSVPKDNAFAASSLQDVPESAEADTAEKHSYGDILKSSALIGGSQVLSIAIGIVRTKAMAVMLGPAGFGLMGIYTSIADLIRSVAEMGINNSGVRQIAAAVGTADTERIALTAKVLRRTTILLGIFGAVLMVMFSLPLSSVTFGSQENAGAIALLSLAVLFKLVADGQGALIQGMRRISDLAKIGVLGALFGTILSIPLVYFLREDGVVPSIVGIAAMSLITSWWYSRKVRMQAPVMSGTQVKQESVALLKLGSAFMASSLMMMGAAYAVRTMILRIDGLDAAGLYQAAWTLGGLYVSMILQAMGADFYPRLTGVAKDNTQVNRLVNEQAQISLLLAGPGVIATLTLAPLLMVLFYSSEFDVATEVLRWICLGMTLRVISWPIGYIIVARGEQTIFFLTELAWTAVNLGLAWICVEHFGLNGAGLAFFGSYVFHTVMIYVVVHRLSGFRWSAANRKTGLVFLALVAGVFCSFFLLPTLVATGLGVLATILSGVYSIRALLTLVSLEQIPRPIRKLLVLFRFARIGTY